MGKQEQKQEKQQKEQEEEGGQRGGAARRRCVLLRLALALWRGQLYRLADACARGRAKKKKETQDPSRWVGAFLGALRWFFALF